MNEQDIAIYHDVNYRAFYVSPNKVICGLFDAVSNMQYSCRKDYIQAADWRYKRKLGYTPAEIEKMRIAAINAASIPCGK